MSALIGWAYTEKIPVASYVRNGAINILINKFEEKQTIVRSQSTHSSIIRTAGYVVAIIINADLVHRGCVLKQNNENCCKTSNIRAPQ